MDPVTDLGSSELRVWPFKMDGKNYVLKEPDAAASVAHKNALYHGARVEDGKVHGLTIADAEPVLVAGCLFEVLPNGSERQVPTESVQALPERILKQLYAKCKELGKDADPKGEQSS